MSILAKNATTALLLARGTPFPTGGRGGRRAPPIPAHCHTPPPNNMLSVTSLIKPDAHAIICTPPPVLTTPRPPTSTYTGHHPHAPTMLLPPRQCNCKPVSSVIPPHHCRPTASPLTQQHAHRCHNHLDNAAVRALRRCRPGPDNATAHPF
jgi:hypothetical protein